MTTMLERSRSYVVLDHQFFASILLRHPMVKDSTISTLSMSHEGRIRYNEAFFESLPVSQAVFGLCHEILHYTSKHALREGTRDHRVWNEACDAWINGMLVDMKIGEPIPGIIMMHQASQHTAEELYDIRMKEKKEREKQKKKQKSEGEGAGAGDGASCGGASDDPSTDPLAGDVELPPEGMSESERAEREGAITQEVAEAAQGARTRGPLPALLQKFIASIVESRVPWFETLERFMVDKVSNDYSWARPNRRYMPNAYLPQLNSVGAMGEIVVQVDVSGSISKAEIAHYNGHLKRIVELCSPEKVHVIYTDTEVKKHVEFERGEEFGIEFYSGGGTDMRAGFDFIDKMGITPACVITLTDGFTPFPEATDYSAIWCISSSRIKSPTGETIHFSLND